MGDFPSSSLEDDNKTIDNLSAEIEALQQQYEALAAQNSLWQRKCQLLRQRAAPMLQQQNCRHPNDDSAGQSPHKNQIEEGTLQDQLHVFLQSAHFRQVEALEDFRSTMGRRKRLVETCQLARESKALYDAFHIGYQGPFATINGLRLGAEATVEDYHHNNNADNDGRGLNGSNAPDNAYTTVKVPWSEINSALGLLALLLSCLEQKPHTGIRYKHEIVCCGSTSKIGIGPRRSDEAAQQRMASSTTAALSYYNLYSDDSFQFFGRRNFNTALQCLVQCVADAAEAIQRVDPTIHLPHAIERGTRDLTVGGLPVAYGTDGVEWTRAMKYLLTDVKHLTAFRNFGLRDVVLEN